MSDLIHRMRILCRFLLLLVTTSLLITVASSAVIGRSPLIVQEVSNGAVARLAGNVPGGARHGQDLGAAPDELQLNDMGLVLRRGADQEAALTRALAALQDPKSASYHRWLSPADFGARYGAAEADVRTLSAWLTAQGFAVRGLTHGRNVLRFTGTAAQVASAFRTQIHNFQDGTGRRWSNVSDPVLPAAFAPAVAGIIGLHSFNPRPQHVIVGAQAASWHTHAPQFTDSTGVLSVGPADFSTIYGIQPLRNKGITGKGSTIAIVAQSNINASQVYAYWSAFGVTGQQTVQVLVPPGTTDPGLTGDDTETEALLDTEIAGGLAQDASIVLVPASFFGNAAIYAIDNNLAPILSVSFGVCESALAASDNALTLSLFQEAAAAGISVVVSSGDQGSAACDIKDDTGPEPATQGVAVNAFASTPYDTAVGGTDFDFSVLPVSSYWSPTNTPGTFASALSYMPEMAWNSSCANPLILRFLTSYSSNEQLCNDPAQSGGVVVEAGSGGTSTLYASPSWQTGVIGLPAGEQRAVPDVSFFAANGAFGFAWAICDYTNSTCDPSGAEGAGGGYTRIGGTSASAPAFAAIVALLLQTQVTATNPDGRTGVLNAALYRLAAAQYGTSLDACNSSSGANVASTCVFHDVTAGSIAVPCTTGSVDCVTQSTNDAYGIVSVGGQPAYPATAGYDPATGLGSLNASNFVTALWIPVAPASLGATPADAAINLSWTASDLAKTYNVYQGKSPGGESGAPVLVGVSGSPVTVSGLTNGATYYFKVAAVNGGGTSGFSGEASATVLPSAPASLAASAGDSSVNLSWTASKGAVSYNIFQGTTAGGEGATPIRSGVTGTSASITGLTNGQHVYFVVTGVNGGGSSAKSNEANATPAAPSSGGGGGLDLLMLVALGAAVVRAAPRRGGGRIS